MQTLPISKLEQHLAILVFSLFLLTMFYLNYLESKQQLNLHRYHNFLVHSDLDLKNWRSFFNFYRPEKLYNLPTYDGVDEEWINFKAQGQFFIWGFSLHYFLNKVVRCCSSKILYRKIFNIDWVLERGFGKGSVLPESKNISGTCKNIYFSCRSRIWDPF